MKFLKLLGLAVVVAAALMAFVGTASATELTSPAGTKFNGIIQAELNGGLAKLTNSFGVQVECARSTFEGSIVNAGGAAETVSGNISSLTFGSGLEGTNECNCNVKVLTTGSFEIHTEGATANGNGTFTSNGAEVTTECSTVAGRIHCIWKTSNTDWGKLTGGTPAILTVNGPIPRVGGRSGALCGSSATFTAAYKITSPSTLLVD